MIKLLRQRAIENPIFFRGLMGLLAITFIVSLGWWGSQEESSRSIATVDQEKISLEEYTRAYQNTARFYTQMLKQPFDKETLRKQVLDQMVDQRLWLKEAARMGLHITDAELMEAILKLPGFQENGQFHQERYRRLLALEKITPEKFERQQRDEMLVQKAKTLIRDSTALTVAEVEDLEKSNPPDIHQAQTSRLAQKQEKAVHAYTLALKQKATIVINDELL